MSFKGALTIRPDHDGTELFAIDIASLSSDNSAETLIETWIDAKSQVASSSKEDGLSLKITDWKIGHVGFIALKTGYVYIW